MDRNSYSLLKNKQIIEILDGDMNFGDYIFDDGTKIKIAMPYLSGSNLYELSTNFGLPTTYQRSGGALSRRQYLEDLIDYCIEKQKCSTLLSHMFNKSQFTKILSGHGASEINNAYNTIISKVIDNINGLLLFGGHKLTKSGNDFIVHEIEEKIEIKTPIINGIDREYIKSLFERAMADVEKTDYDSAVTKARTLLEETFCYVIEKNNEVPNDSGDISQLYKQVKKIYNMHGSSELDKLINKLLSGLENIVKGIAEMRNISSDSHGVGARRLAIKDYHARLIVNSSAAMADFILSVQQNNPKI